MKNLSLILIVICLMLIARFSWALSINSSYVQNSAGAYVKQTQVMCTADEAVSCQALCQQDTDCRRVEPYCLNCAGTSSTLLRTLYMQVSQNYVATQNEIATPLLVNYLASDNYILVGAKSVFNYYKPLNSDELLSDLQALCPTSTVEPLLAIQLNEEQQPAKLSFVLCKDEAGISRAYDVAPRQPVVGTQAFSLKVNLKFN